MSDLEQGRFNAMSAIAFVPVIGNVKYIKNTGKAISKADDVLDAAKVSDKLDSIIDLMKKGKKIGKNIITQIDEDTQIIFRRDIGKYAHKIDEYGYKNPVNHYNIEIQTKSQSGKFKPKWDYHIILDEFGEVIDSFASGIWTKKGR